MIKNPLFDMSDCTLCPRECHVNRLIGETGYCQCTSDLLAARAALHMWEEPCISGANGSGAVFFCGCNMGCVFCQNYDIAHARNGRKLTPEHLFDIFLMLQDKGAHNINLVTPSHYIPQIITALTQAKMYGLTIPVVYNTSAYEKVEVLRSLEGLIDVYLPDLKYFSSTLSSKYSAAPDYFEVASAAIAEMVRQIPAAVFETDEDSLIKKGVIVRHLMLPGCEEDSRAVLQYLHKTYGEQIYISIMNQYTPLSTVAQFPELNRTISSKAYDRMIDYAISIGIENGFIQEGETASESFIPSFDGEGL